MQYQLHILVQFDTMDAWLSCSHRLAKRALDMMDQTSAHVFVGDRGAYTIEWLFVLNNYCRKTSRLREIGASGMLSLPAFLVSIALDSTVLRCLLRDAWGDRAVQCAGSRARTECWSDHPHFVVA